VASVYAHSPLNLERGAFGSTLAQPGAAAPDGRFEDGFLIERLPGEFTVAYFGGEVPGALCVARKGHDALFARYGVEDQATYVLRPDGHVLARCDGIDPAFAAQALARVTGYQASAQPRVPHSLQPESDRLFDRLSARLDALPEAGRAAALALEMEKLEKGV